MAVWQISLSVMAVYMVIVILIGVKANKSGVGTVDEFFLAGRSLGPFVLLMTYSATYQSAFAFLGAAGMFYVHGASFLVCAVWTVTGAVLAYFIGIRIYLISKRYSFVTPGEMLGSYYGEWIKPFFGVLSICWITLYMVVQLMGAGYIFEIATQGVIPYSVGSIVLLGVVILYVSLGGFRAVAWTDAFQGMYMIIALFFAAAVVIGKVGGFSELMIQFQNVMPENLTMPGGAGLFKPGIWFSWALMAIIGHAICMPYSWVRFNTANSAKTLRLAVLLSPFYLTILYIPIFIIGMGGRILMPGLDAPDTVLPLMLFKYLSPFAAALIVTGALAAMKSTVDSYVHIISAMVARDVYPMIKRDSTEKEQIKVGRIVIVVVGIVAYILSQMKLGMLVTVGVIAYSGGAQFFPALFGAIFWKRGTAAGAWSSIITGIAIMLYAKFVNNPVPVFDPGTLGLMCGSIVYFIVSMLTKPLSQEVTDKYHGYLKETMHSNVADSDSDFSSKSGGSI